MATEQLTPAQRLAVENRGGPMLVSAAAGSGKTKVLVDRLLSYLTDPQDPANVDDFLIITYTKAAASELRGKIASKLTERLSQTPGDRHLQHQLQRLYLAKISTVHAFCADILREYSFVMDLPGDVRVADEAECQDLRANAMDAVLDRAYQQIGKDPEMQALVDTQGFGRSDKAVPEILYSVYDAARCHVEPEKWLKTTTSQDISEDITDAAQTPWGKYLLDHFMQDLDGQIAFMQRAIRLAQKAEDMEKAYGETLEQNLEQLQFLRESKTWDEAGARQILSFGRLKPLRKPEQPDLVEQVKALRSLAYEQVKKRQEPFSIPSEKLLEDMRKSSLAVRGLQRLVLEFSEAYELEKNRRRILDFGDLEHKALELLLGKNLTGATRAAREIAARFREVMVDEYQDTNAVQDRIFSVLTQERGNCFLVGDVKQSIYRFRLADPGIFLDKYHRFVPAEEAQPGEGRKVLLSENFRSGPEILEASNQVFRNTMCPAVGGLYYGEAEALRPGLPRDPLKDPAVELHCIQVPDEEGKYPVEANFVAQRIGELLQDRTEVRTGSGLRPVEPGDIVILLRSPGTCAKYYLEALEKRNIPATTDAGGSILDTGEISVLRSFLQVLDNPLQDIPLEAVLGSPIFGFSADFLGSIRAAHPKCFLYEALHQSAADGNAQAGDFLSQVEALRQIARLETLSRLLEEIDARTHLEAVFSAMPDGEQRLKNLEFFFQKAVEFEKGGRQELSQFLDHLEHLEERGLRLEDSGANANSVHILSIHKSKGLEYPVVFLSNLSGKFNLEDVRSHVLVDAELGVGCNALEAEQRYRYPTLAKMAISRRIQEENTSEELRVLYVAMTRAKDRLIMTYADSYLKKHLADLCSTLSGGSNFELSRDAGCLGQWVLMTALGLTEAGELFLEGVRPMETALSPYPWKICCHEPEPEEPQAHLEAVEPVPVELPEAQDLEALLNAKYPHPAATTAPSKITATQLKGRVLDEEAAEHAPTPRRTGERKWTVPEFVAPKKLQSREIGIATHLAMQFVRYEECGTAEGLEAELHRLEEQQFLTPRQIQAVERKWILDFFQTDLGKRLRSGGEVLREFKFSLLESGALLDEALKDEKLLLQGVVDCCLMEPDGMTVLDFKTDHVLPGQEDRLANHYANQVRTYGKALQRIFEKPVKKLLLYFFRTGTFREIPME